MTDLKLCDALEQIYGRNPQDSWRPLDARPEKSVLEKTVVLGGP